MAFWIELRCEQRNGIKEKDCWSNYNAGPMELCAEDNASIAMTIRHMRNQVKQLGWKRIREGWVCPDCL